jgi:membrane fusion protein (multidrug efflux system)
MITEKSETPPTVDGEKPAPAAPVSAESAAPPAHAAAHSRSGRKPLLIGIVAVIAIVALIFGVRWILAALSTVSTDDAYVNSHVTFVAPRVAGQVAQVYVDDNNRVRNGDLLVQLDKEPYVVQVNIKKAAVASAEADLHAIRAQVRGGEALARSLRWKLQHAMEDVQNQVAALKTAVAALESARAVARRAKADVDRAEPLVQKGAISSEEMDRRKQVLEVADAQVKQALQGVYQIRASLGLPEQPGDDLASVPRFVTFLWPFLTKAARDLTFVPGDLDESFSSVRQAQSELMQAAFQIGVVYPLDKKPRKMLADFLARDPGGDLDKIYAKILDDAPAVRQAQEKVALAERDLDQAILNLKYCDVRAEIDGVVTRRNVNPGNNLIAGQEVMAIRSLREIWVDANFKETELANLRIGQPVDLRVDMYGKRKSFKGRISGFTMGTGSTLALLPAQNATGNFVKVVQRLPVRIDIVDYDPDTEPLFVGLSVEPVVHIKEPPSGPDAGKVLQPYLAPSLLPATNPAPATSPTLTNPGSGT